MQNAQVIPFRFETREVRTLLIDDQPWFVATDVCESLAIVNTARAMSRLDDDERGIHSMNTPGGAQKLSVVNESGLYSIILTSRKAEAKRFKKWVTAEVLPSIRKHGHYSATTGKMNAVPAPPRIVIVSSRELREMLDCHAETYIFQRTTGAAEHRAGNGRLLAVSISGKHYMDRLSTPALALRPTLTQDQDECQDMLWTYWREGEVERAGAISASQMATMSKHRLALMKELMHNLNKGMRDALGAEITRLSVSMGLPVPALDAIGTGGLLRSDNVADFWVGVLQLDAKGIPYNHCKDPQFIGLNMPHLSELFKANGIQVEITSDLTTALRRCTEPRFLDLKTVKSRIRKVATKCWVFKKPATAQ